MTSPSLTLRGEDFCYNFTVLNLVFCRAIGKLEHLSRKRLVEPLQVEEPLSVEEPHFLGEPQGLEEPEQLEPAARPCAVQTGPGPLSAGVLQVHPSLNEQY